MIVDIIHGGIRNYTKLACNSLKMIPNDSFSANQIGDDRPLIPPALVATGNRFCVRISA